MPYKANTPTPELEELVASLGGEWHGAYAMVVCPAHADGTPSLSLRQGDRGILVHCFAGCDRGAILRTLGNPSVPGRNRTSTEKSSDTSALARRLWDEASGFDGTIAETYLRARALPLDLPDIRFHGSCPKKGSPRQPAMIAAVREGHEVISIHRIFLKPDGSWHDGKQMLGRPRSSAWRTGYPAGSLGIAEGIEDAAAFYRWTGIPCWSALSSGNIANVAIPDHVNELYVAFDQGGAGEACVEKLQRLHGGRMKVIPASPKPCDDWAAKGVWLEGRGRKEASNGGASDENRHTSKSRTQ